MCIRDSYYGAQKYIYQFMVHVLKKLMKQYLEQKRSLPELRKAIQEITDIPEFMIKKLKKIVVMGMTWFVTAKTGNSIGKHFITF